MSEPNDTEATAYHEAGHAVMALALGRPVDRVTIRPTTEHLGTCFFGKAVFRPTEDWLEREMLIALAGPAAEARHTGEYAWEEGVRDRDYAYDLALQRAGGNARQAQKVERRTLAKTEHLLAREENWQAVERLAAELLRVGEISGRAARHLFNECRREER